MDAGEKKEQETEINEKMKRVGTDLAGTSAMLAIDEPKGKLKSATDRHRAAKTRVQTLLTKLGKALSGCEASMPGLKRKVAPDAYKRLRSGVCAIRDLRDQVMDELEDLKNLPQDTDSQDMCIDGLLRLQRSLVEHHSALLEAWDKHKEPIVKEDKDEPMHDSQHEEHEGL